MPDEIASLKRQLAALQQLFQDLSEEHYDCDKLIKQLLQEESDRRALSERVDELEMVTIKELKRRVRGNTSELKRDRYYVLLTGIGFIGLIAAGFYFYAQMSLEDQRVLAKEMSGKIAGFVCAIVVAAIGVERWQKK